MGVDKSGEYKWKIKFFYSTVTMKTRFPTELDCYCPVYPGRVSDDAMLRAIAEEEEKNG